MTKEELKQEAKEWIAKNSKEFITNPKYSPFDYAEGIYLAGAEPREKRIAELEVTNKKISNECHKLVDSLEKKQNENELLETQNIKLQAEVSRLTIKNAELKADNDARKFAMAMSEKVEKQLREENTKLKDVIEGYKKIAKWCDKCDKIAELEKENAELRNNGFTVSAMTEQQLKVALEKGEQLEKENAELKDDNKVMADNYSKMELKFYNELAKAKDLLLRFIELKNKPCASGHSINMLLYENICVETEQFISEV